MGPDEISRTWNSRIFIRSIENSGVRFVSIMKFPGTFLLTVNILVVICEKLNFQKSKVHELGKNPENKIFGILELNI